MSITDKLTGLSSLTSSRRPTWSRGLVLLATWDQQNVSFVLVESTRQKITVVDCGIETLQQELPPMEQLRNICKERSHRVEKLLIAAPRAQLEMLALEVPQAEEDELAALVKSEVDGQFGDGEQSLVADYCRLQSYRLSGNPANQAVALTDNDPTTEPTSTPTSEPPISAVAFALEAKRLTAWQTAAEEHGFTLIGLTSRQLAPIASLQRDGAFRKRLTIMVAIYAGEVELSFILRGRLALLRTFRFAASSLESLGEQIQMEVQRSASMVDFGDATTDAEMVLLQRDHGLKNVTATNDSDTDPPSDRLFKDQEWTELIEQLDAREVHLSPSDALIFADTLSGIPEPALIGCSLDAVSSRMAIDLLHPKQPVKPPNPALRWSAIGAFAVLSLAVVGFVLWSDVRELAAEVETAEQALERAENIANKLQEQADQARYVESWLQDQVDWLGRLEDLSKQFPDGQEANVRRLSATLDDYVGVFDLSIQVSDPSHVASLENRLRSAEFAITSEQISEQSGNTEYPWQFEATVAFALESVDLAEDELVLVSQANPDTATETTDLAPNSATEPSASEAPSGESIDEADRQPTGTAEPSASSSNDEATSNGGTS